MRPLRLYLEYRRQGLRRAWALSGMTHLAASFARGAIIGALIVAAATALATKAQAIQDEADNRAAAKIHQQAALINSLSAFLNACLGPREGSIWIGDELHLCHALPTGVKR